MGLEFFTTLDKIHQKFPGFQTPFFYILIDICYYMLTFVCLQESRVLKFWFPAETDYLDKVTSAYEFFKELVRPEQFPRGMFILLIVLFLTIVMMLDHTVE